MGCWRWVEVDFQHLYGIDLTVELLRSKKARWLVWRLTGLLEMVDSLARKSLASTAARPAVTMDDDEPLPAEDDDVHVPAWMVAS